jgi:large subunit ribosomal protein L31
MKQGIHPDFVETHVTCSCGNTFTTRSVKPELHVELCNQCHPFYTGKQKLVDTGGRVERFQKKYGNRSPAGGAAAAAPPAPAEEVSQPAAEESSAEEVSPETPDEPSSEA